MKPLPSRPLRAAVVQFEHAAGDKAANFAKIRAFAAQAADEGIELVVFPECCLTGYWFLHRQSRDEIAALAERVPDGPSTAELVALARSTDVMLGAGLVEDGGDERLFNTFVVAAPDGTVVKHRKLHAFVSEHLTSGDAFTVFEGPAGWNLGILTCYDNNLGENVRLTALMGADVILAPHQTGGCRSDDPNIMGLVDRRLWDRRHEDPEAIEAELKGDKGRGWLLRWLPTRAHDNGVFYLFANGIGVDDDEIRTGNSMIIDPYGRILAETWTADDAMVRATLDPALLDDNTGRRWITARRPELYRPLAEPTGREVDMRTARFSGKGA